MLLSFNVNNKTFLEMWFSRSAFVIYYVGKVKTLYECKIYECKIYECHQISEILNDNTLSMLSIRQFATWYVKRILNMAFYPFTHSKKFSYNYKSIHMQLHSLFSDDLICEFNDVYHVTHVIKKFTLYIYTHIQRRQGM